MTAPIQACTRGVNHPYPAHVKKGAVNRKYKYFCGVLYLSTFIRKVMVKMNVSEFGFSNLASYLKIQIFLSILPFI